MRHGIIFRSRTGLCSHKWSVRGSAAAAAVLTSDIRLPAISDAVTASPLDARQRGGVYVEGGQYASKLGEGGVVYFDGGERGNCASQMREARKWLAVISGCAVPADGDKSKSP